MNTQTLGREDRMTLFSWQLLFARGVAALAFVIAALLDFGATMTLLIWFFAIYVFFDGGYSAIRCQGTLEMSGVGQDRDVRFPGCWFLSRTI
ncbi:hypothetical protein ACQAYK_02630 [Acidithiobacillus sp. AC3]